MYVRKRIRDAVELQRDYILTGEPRDIISYQQAVPPIRNQINSLRQLSPDNIHVSARIDTLDSLAGRMVVMLDEMNRERRVTPRYQLLDSLADDVDSTMAARKRAFVQIDRLEETADSLSALLIYSSKRAEHFEMTLLTIGSMSALTILILSFIIFLVEARARQRTERDLIEQRKRLEIVAQNLGAGLCIISLDKKIEWSNNVANALFGNLNGKTCYEMFKCPNGEKSGCPSTFLPNHPTSNRL